MGGGREGVPIYIFAKSAWKLVGGEVCASITRSVATNEVRGRVEEAKSGTESGRRDTRRRIKLPTGTIIF